MANKTMDAYIVSFLILLLQMLLIIILKSVAYEEKYRFRQTRFITALLVCFSVLILFMLAIGKDFTEKWIFYTCYALVLIGIFIMESIERAKETSFKDLTKTLNFFENTNLTGFASIVYKLNDNGNIELTKLGEILKSVSFVFDILNISFVVLLPILSQNNIVVSDNALIIILTCVTILFTELYLFLSQRGGLENIEFSEKGLLKNPKEWSTEIEKKYGTHIVGYSDIVSTSEEEISTTLINLEDLSRDILNDKNILISNSSKHETEAIYYNVINKDFINKKSTLIIFEDIPSVKEAQNVIDSMIEEYNRELIAKVISKFQTVSKIKTDKDINIYLTTIQDLTESNIDYEKIQTIIINNVDKIIEKNSNDLFVLATTLKNLNNENQYIMLSSVTEALRATLKNILLIDNFKEYQINRKKASQTLGIQILKRKADNIKSHHKNSYYFNDLVKIAIETNKFLIDNIEIISKKMPIQNDINRFDEVRGNRKQVLNNSELTHLTNRIKINSNNIFQEAANKKMFLKNDDEKNLIYNIKAYSELNNGETYLGIISSDYLLRDFMISEYLKKNNNIADFDLILPQRMQNDAKILLEALLLQMLNNPVKEDVIIRRLKEYDKNLILINGYNKLNIVSSINSLLEAEFKIKTDITSYLIETVDKDNKKEYMLNHNFKAKLPKDLYEKAKFIMSGYEQEITPQKGYEVYQKYIPGQVHFIENNVYKIEEIENLDILVSNVTADNIRKYKQDIEINLSEIKSDKQNEEIKEYAQITIKKQLNLANIEVNTLGYYEFVDYTTLEKGQFIYRKLTEAQKDKANRNYYNNKVLKIEIIPKDENLKKMFSGELRDKIAYTLSFLMNEMMESLLDENSPYVIVKAVISNKKLIENEEVKLYRPIIDESITKDSIVLYIMEDLKINKGLLATIENDISRILSLMKKYLIWKESDSAKESNYLNHINVNGSLALKEVEKIIPDLF